MQTRIKKKRRIVPVLPIYLAAVVWFVYALLFPLVRWWHFLIVSVISIAAWGIARMICPVKIVEEEVPGPVFTTGNEDTDGLLREGYEALRKLPQLDAAIRHEGVSREIVRIEKSLEAILNQLKRSPQKAGELRRMMNYYLPTTLKFLETYARFEGQPVQGENARDAMRQVENIMGTIADAFEKQLDSLNAGEALDVSTDITVLEGMLSADYAESPFLHQ